MDSRPTGTSLRAAGCKVKWRRHPAQDFQKASWPGWPCHFGWVTFYHCEISFVTQLYTLSFILYPSPSVQLRQIRQLPVLLDQAADLLLLLGGDLQALQPEGLDEQHQGVRPGQAARLAQHVHQVRRLVRHAAAILAV